MTSLLQGFQVVFEPATLIYILGGTVAGVIIGAMPGMSASMAVVLAMTFSYSMQPLPAIAFLVAVYCAAITGGGITAILFSIPGTPSSATTTFDGYPMAMRGEAGKALGISLVASAIGGMIAAVCMAVLTPQLAAAALKFGPSELFAVSFLGLSILTCLDSGNVVKTIISGLMGLWLACIGLDPIIGNVRFTFGITKLVAGVELIPVMIGLFAATEVLKQVSKGGKQDLDLGKNASVKTQLSGLGLWGMKFTILRSSLIGTIVGILPGAGATIASFLSYAIEVKTSKHPERYGKGEPRGIAASEAANNAATGGAMVPLLALGIPGGNAAAVMATALAIKGVNMGPLLLTSKPVYMYATFASMVLTNITMVIVSIMIAKVFAKVLSVPYYYLGTLIVLLSALGSFAGSKATSDVMLMAIAGILGYGFIRMGFNSAALVLGLVLGQMCEKNLRNAITLAKGDLVEVFLGKPITLVLLLVCAVMLIYPILKPLIMKKMGKDKAGAKA